MSKFVRPAAEGADPFGTARLRRGVLDAWATSPARFREDANAEEDLVLGGYRDRLVVELAQNAADAAARAKVPGRLRLTLRDGVLVAANTVAPLDAGGVESLSTLRASAKRDAQGHDGAVGRFGVGFAAVLAVTDEPAVVGRHGGIRWSLA
uniref:sacsin N-terminal ATP-binding-like domain-containing protein n=1 Tax=Streptomyces scabiei TaxID=1930 RepID=UPI000AA97D75